ncbi:MAG: hypothetical protein RMJ16_04515 [Thermoguttaceae bacterium]|nr:hypothetical protein [Thermoguttaceae bacterium]
MASYSRRDIELVSAFLDGQLTEPERSELESRLPREPRLRRLLRELGRVRALVRSLPPVQSEADLAGAFLEAAGAYTAEDRCVLCSPIPLEGLETLLREKVQDGGKEGSQQLQDMAAEGTPQESQVAQPPLRREPSPPLREGKPEFSHWWLELPGRLKNPRIWVWPAVAVLVALFFAWWPPELVRQIPSSYVLPSVKLDHDFALAPRLSVEPELARPEPSSDASFLLSPDAPAMPAPEEGGRRAIPPDEGQQKALEESLSAGLAGPGSATKPLAGPGPASAADSVAREAEAARSTGAAGLPEWREEAGSGSLAAKARPGEMGFEAREFLRQAIGSAATRHELTVLATKLDGEIELRIEAPERQFDFIWAELLKVAHDSGLQPLDSAAAEAEHKVLPAPARGRAFAGAPGLESRAPAAEGAGEAPGRLGAEEAQPGAIPPSWSPRRATRAEMVLTLTGTDSQLDRFFQEWLRDRGQLKIVLVRVTGLNLSTALSATLRRLPQESKDEVWELVPQRPEGLAAGAPTAGVAAMPAPQERSEAPFTPQVRSLPQMAEARQVESQGLAAPPVSAAARRTPNREDTQAGPVPTPTMSAQGAPQGGPVYRLTIRLRAAE